MGCQCAEESMMIY